MSKFNFISQHAKLAAYRDQITPGENWQQCLSLNYEHARQRTQERFGFELSMEDWEKLNWQIFLESPNRATFVAAKNEDTTVYDVDFVPQKGRRRQIRVFYSESRLCISTVVTAERSVPFTDVWSPMLGARRKIRLDFWTAGEGANAITQADKVELDRRLKFANLIDRTRGTAGNSKPMPVPSHFPEPSPAVVQTKPKATPVEPTKPVLTITDANVAEIGAKLWEALTGSSKSERTKLMHSLIVEIKKAKAAERANVIAPAKLTKQNEATAVQFAVGKYLGKVTTNTFPIMGVKIRIGEVFRLAEMLEHPMGKPCRDFLDLHRLKLREVRTHATGRAGVLIVQE